jgi:hypothetical protein
MVHFQGAARTAYVEPDEGVSQMVLRENLFHSSLYGLLVSVIGVFCIEVSSREVLVSISCDDLAAAST